MLKIAVIILWIINILKITIIPPDISNPLYYGAYFACAALFLAHGWRTCKINPLMLLFISIAVLSTAYNLIIHPDISFFNPIERISAFTIIMIAIGPLLIYKDEKPQFLYFSLLEWSFASIAVLSFFMFLFGRGYNGTNTMFVGLTTHAMSLGPIAGVAVLFFIHLIYTSKRKSLRNCYLIGMIFSLLSCTLAGSRGALGAAFIASAFLVYKQYSKRTCAIIMTVSIAVAASTSPIWLPYTAAMQKKMEYASEVGHSSRDALWNDRVAEFEDSPVLGQGFASINRAIAIHTPYSNTSRSLEAGSSWLFVMSSLGIIGLIVFMCLFFRAIIPFAKEKSYSHATFRTAILIFYAIHLWIEGYVLHTGGMMFALFWLVLTLNYWTLYAKSFTNNKSSRTIYQSMD